MAAYSRGNLGLVVEADLAGSMPASAGGDVFGNEEFSSNVGGGLISKSSTTFSVNMEQAYEEFENHAETSNYELKANVMEKV